MVGRVQRLRATGVLPVPRAGGGVVAERGEESPPGRLPNWYACDGPGQRRSAKEQGVAG